MSRWINRQSSHASAPFRLFCLPYAGGSASIYRHWQRALPDAFEVCAVCLPGRASRFGEEAHSKMSTLTAALVEALEPELDRPFFLFGHSMGAMVAYELASALRAQGIRMPRHLFLSGRPGYELFPRHRIDPPIPDSALIGMLSALNGTPEGVFANKELLDFMLPPLRADMTLVQTHRHRHERPLSCGITAFGGLNDPTVDKDGLTRWRSLTSGPFRLHMFEGDHFFLNTNPAPLLDIIARTMTRLGRIDEANLAEAP